MQDQSRPADSGPALTTVGDRPTNQATPAGASPGASVPVTPPRLLVACLCAAWCRVCEDYRPAISRVAEEFPDHRFVDLDIEDHEDLVDGLDIEQFPTFLIATGDEVRFFGPLPPQADALRLTVRAAAGSVCVVTGPVHLAAWRRIRDAIAGGVI